MGPLGPVSARDGEPAPLGTDQVKRAQAFVQRHPEVSITSPRQNGTREHIASWVIPAADPSADPVVGEARHDQLRWLMDYLEAKFDQGDGGKPGQ